MDEEIEITRAKAIDGLPDNWWCSSSTVNALLEWFGRYVVGLLISARIEGELHHEVYTGFMFGDQDRSFWFTAVHVLREIEDLEASDKAEVIQKRWLDQGRIGGAESVPAHNYRILESLRARIAPQLAEMLKDG